MSSFLNSLSRYGINVKASFKSVYIIGLDDSSYILEETDDGVTITRLGTTETQKVETLDDILNYIDSREINLIREIAEALRRVETPLNIM